jgi:hypothetical protein
MPRFIFTTLVVLLATGCASQLATDAPIEVPNSPRSWLAGDHHIHSQFSVGWDDSVSPPRPIKGGDAKYPIYKNAERARHFGLDWMVATDHGGPNHSKVSLEWTYPELQRSRELIPQVIQFMGLELNTPGADHSSIIVPHSDDEHVHLYEYEKRFDKREPWPADESQDNTELMAEALKFVDQYPKKPVVIAHHPSRSALNHREFGLTTPEELRTWNDAAPEVAVGMEGAPGHQAAVFSSRQGMTVSGTPVPDWVYARGAYGRGFPTMGGFDQMTATLGGFWDSMLGEGRRWWITANSDSHIHYTEGGIDFWPGEYSKTFVYAEKNYDDILEGIRAGRVFVATGDLAQELYLSIKSDDQLSEIGGKHNAQKGEAITIEIVVRDPDALNANGDNPTVARIDLIQGLVTGKHGDHSHDTNDSTQVIQRFDASSWRKDDEFIKMRYRISPQESIYLRVRGTNTEQLEPEPDPIKEDPWTDLWFYSNPIFITVE